jgi:predicted TIM-barrel fold metal-dependent hydrolase
VALASLAFNGIFDRFPNARFAFLEAGVAWLLTAMERLTGSYAAFTPDDPSGRYLQLRPGEKVKDYLKRHIREGRIFIGCEGDEDVLPYAVGVVGNSPFVFSSDFPHEVNARSCRAEIDEALESTALSADDKAAILGGNAERLYTPRPAAAPSHVTLSGAKGLPGDPSLRSG